MKTTIIKEYLKQQYDKYESEKKDANKAWKIALQNKDEDEIYSQRRRIEYALICSSVVFDMYKDLTGGERIDGKTADEAFYGRFCGSDGTGNIETEKFTIKK